MFEVAKLNFKRTLIVLDNTLNFKRLHKFIVMLLNGRGKLFFIEEHQLINLQEMLEFKTHRFVLTKVITDSDKHNQ